LIPPAHPYQEPGMPRQPYQPREKFDPASVSPEERDWSIAEFCVRKNISEPMFYKMKRQGRAPQVNPYTGRISPEARAAWERQCAAAAESDSIKLQRERRKVQAQLAGQASSRSPRHFHSKQNKKSNVEEVA
jgi:hypothetical protein